MIVNWNFDDIAQMVLSVGDPLQAFSKAAAPVLVTSLWQGGLVALCLAVCLRLTPRTAASLRFALWAMAFVLLVALGFLPGLMHLTGLRNVHESSGLESAAAAVGNKPWLEFDIRWSVVLVGLWASASVYRAADLLFHGWILRKLWKTARPVADESCNAVASLCAETRRAQLCMTDEIERPSVIGFLAPRVLIPSWLMERLTPVELEQVVLHETEHLRRGDDWTNLFQKLALVVFPLNPALIWMDRKLCLEREMACDEGVVARTRAPRAYAACLTRLAERGVERRAGRFARVALSLGAWQRRPELVERIHSILRGKTVLGPWIRNGIMAVAGCGLIVGSVELARCPQLVSFERNTHTIATSAAVTGTQQQVEVASLHRSELKPVSARNSANPQHRPNVQVRTNGREVEPVVEASQGGYFTQLSAAQTLNSEDDGAGATSWIVLTSAEQPSMADVYSDYSNETEFQERRTRLLLRVSPQGQVYPALAAVPTRTGWLIIKL